MHKEFYGWSLESSGKGTVDTKYIIEYVNDEKVWKKICYIDDHYSEIEPCQESWELYSKREYDNIADALSFYMSWFASDECFFLQMYEQIFVNGEMILEQIVEPRSDVMYCMRNQIGRDLQSRMYNAEDRVKELEKALKLHEKFIEKYHAKDTFEQFVREESKK